MKLTEQEYLVFLKRHKFSEKEINEIMERLRGKGIWKKK